MALGDEQLRQARRDVEKRFALLLECEPDLLRQPGTHYVRASSPAAKAWMGFAVHFLAVRRYGEQDSVVISAPGRLHDTTRDRLRGVAAPDAVNSALLEIATSLGCDDSYLCEVLVGAEGELDLVESRDVVAFGPGARDVKSWDGKVLAEDVDGPIFATFDDAGVTAWAGVKRVSPWAHDVQLATRPDMRRRGLARAVASAAFRQIVRDGVTPYYAHGASNKASAALARSLGFRPWGQAVFAESRIALP